MFVNKLKMDGIAEAVKKCMAEDDLEETGLRKAAYAAHTKGEKMFTFKGKTYPVKVQGEDVSYGEAVKEETEIDEAMSGEVTRTKTGLVHRSTKAYGGSKPEKHVVDTLKGPKTKDLIGKDVKDALKSRGRYDEQMDFKNKLLEALKGKQHKIDKNKNQKIDAQDFAMLRAQQKEEVELDEKAGYSAKAARAGKDIGKPGKMFAKIAAKAGERYGSKERGEKVAGAILAKLRKEQTEADWTDEQLDQLLEYYDLAEKEMTDAEMAKREKIVKGMKKSLAGFKQRYGARAKDVMYATATKQAMKEDTVEEEIDPNVRTKDTLKGQEPTAQKDDVGPGSDGKSTKVKFRGGPMKEEVKKSDIPAYLRKQKGDKPLTVADVKAPRKDSISASQNLAKARNEEVELDEAKHSDTDDTKARVKAMIARRDKIYDMYPKRAPNFAYGEKDGMKQIRQDKKDLRKNLPREEVEIEEGKRPEGDTVPFITDEKKPPFDKPYTTTKKTVTDKSGAKHTPMSRARDLARQAMKRIKTEMMGKAPGNNG